MRRAREGDDTVRLKRVANVRRAANSAMGAAASGYRALTRWLGCFIHLLMGEIALWPFMFGFVLFLLFSLLILDTTSRIEFKQVERFRV